MEANPNMVQSPCGLNPITQQNSSILSNLFDGGALPKSIFVRPGSISELRTHRCTWNFETDPMGPVPLSETQVSRKQSLIFVIGIRF